jgi:Spy/CpxP family protein refolding chaperone
VRFTRFVVPTLLVAVLALTTFGFSAAQQPAQPQTPRHMGPMGRGFGPPPFAFERLRLTEDQKAAIKALHEKAPAEPPAAVDLQQQLQQAIFGEPQNTAAIETIKAQLLEEHARILQARIDTERQIAGILTAEQRKQLLEMGPSRGRGRGMGRGMGMGFGPGMGMGAGMGLGPGRGMRRGPGGPGGTDPHGEQSR